MSKHRGPRDRGRYSKVSRRKWNDERVQALSWPPPNGLTLWDRLLTGPELGVIPGAFQAWEAGLAQALRWKLEGFRQAFGEVLREGLARADWSVGLVWVPKAIEHNKPESPNVVRSWRDSWEELPECALKAEIYESLRAYLCESMGEPYVKAFDEACRKPSTKPSRKAFGKASSKPWPNQEQEQEQDQPPNIPPAESSPKPSSKGGRRQPKIPIPADWAPSDAHRAKAAKLGLDLPAEIEKFRNNAEGKDVRWVDWGKAFSNWLAQASSFAPRGPRAPLGHQTPHDREQAERDERLLDEIRRGVWGETARQRAGDSARPIDLRRFREAIAAGKVRRVGADDSRPVGAPANAAAGGLGGLLSQIGRPMQ